MMRFSADEASGILVLCLVASVALIAPVGSGGRLCFISFQLHYNLDVLHTVHLCQVPVASVGKNPMVPVVMRTAAMRCFIHIG